MHFYAVHPDADLGAELVSCLFWALHGQSTWVFQCLTHLFTSVPFIITPILQTPVKQEIEESQNGWGWKGPQEVVRPNPGVWSKEVSLEDFGWADAYIPMSSVKSTWGPLQGCTTLRFFILQYPYLACPITQLPICPLLSYSEWWEVWHIEVGKSELGHERIKLCERGTLVELPKSAFLWSWGDEGEGWWSRAPFW